VCCRVCGGGGRPVFVFGGGGGGARGGGGGGGGGVFVRTPPGGGGGGGAVAGGRHVDARPLVCWSFGAHVLTRVCAACRSVLWLTGCWYTAAAAGRRLCHLGSRQRRPPASARPAAVAATSGSAARGSVPAGMGGGVRPPGLQRRAPGGARTHPAGLLLLDAWTEGRSVYSRHVEVPAVEGSSGFRVGLASFFSSWPSVVRPRSGAACRPRGEVHPARPPPLRSGSTAAWRAATRPPPLPHGRGGAPAGHGRRLHTGPSTRPTNGRKQQRSPPHRLGRCASRPPSAPHPHTGDGTDAAHVATGRRDGVRGTRVSTVAPACGSGGGDDRRRRPRPSTPQPRGVRVSSAEQPPHASTLRRSTCSHNGCARRHLRKPHAALGRRRGRHLPRLLVLIVLFLVPAPPHPWRRRRWRRWRAQQRPPSPPPRTRRGGPRRRPRRLVTPPRARIAERPRPQAPTGRRR